MTGITSEDGSFKNKSVKQMKIDLKNNLISKNDKDPKTKRLLGGPVKRQVDEQRVSGDSEY